MVRQGIYINRFGKRGGGRLFGFREELNHVICDNICPIRFVSETLIGLELITNHLLLVSTIGVYFRA
jgi:hypothetical protein